MVKIFEITAQYLAIQERYQLVMKKIISYGGAIFFIITAYIFACIALYSYLWPHIGEALAALSICILFLIISFGFMMLGRRSKFVKKVPPSSLRSGLEPYLESVPESQELLRALRKASPEILVTVLGGIAITALIKYFKKRE